MDSPLASTCGWRLLLALVVSTGCRSQLDETSPAAADDEPPSVAVTVWSDRHEVFAEYTAPVVGEPSRFATHVSVLATGEPRREGPVVYRLQPETGDGSQVVDDQPARDGIYLTEVTYPHAGAWRLRLEVPTEDGVDVIDLGGVEVFGSDAQRAAAPEPAEAEGIAFLKEQQWLLGTLTSLVSTRTLEERIVAPGHIRAAPRLVAEVVPPVSGRLLPPENGTLPGLGDVVQADQLLAWVQPPLSEALLGAVAAEAELARLEIAVEQADVALARVRMLHEQEARSTRELQEAEFAQRAAVTARDGARRALAAYEASGILPAVEDGGVAGPPRFAIRAPIAGTVDAVLAVAGQSVPSDASILRLVDASTVHVQAQVRVEDLPRIDVSSSPHIALAASREQPVELPPDATRLVHVGLAVDERTGRAPVVFATHNPDLLWRPGTAVDVFVAIGRAADAVTVPASALIEDDVGTVVFVQLGGETFERRTVTTGLRDGGFVEVLSGLEPGERVVTDGAYSVRLASVSTTEPAHGHAH